jgi:cyclic pyranopterin phosphate synthase
VAPPGRCRRAAHAEAQVKASDLLYRAIEQAISRKPNGHDFIERRHRRPALRDMSVTGE